MVSQSTQENSMSVIATDTATKTCPRCGGSGKVIERSPFSYSAYSLYPVEYEVDCPNPDCVDGQVEMEDEDE